MKAEHRKEVQALEEERNGLEKEVRESRHKIDELEEKAALVDPVQAYAQETELRDGCGDSSLQANDSSHIARLLDGTEQQLNETREQLRISMEQVEVLRSAQVENSNKGGQDEVKGLKEKLDEAASEQEDLLVMLAEQEEKMGRMKGRLRELGEVVSEGEEDYEEIT